MIQLKKNIQDDLPLLLKVGLIFGLLGYSVSIFISSYFNKDVSVYRFQYVLYLFMLIRIVTGLTKKNIAQANSGVTLSIFYVLIITGPITILFNHVYPLLTFYRSFYIPFLIYFYYLLSIKSSNQIEVLIKWITYSGCFAALFLLLESLSKYFEIATSFTQMIINYTAMKENTGLLSILEKSSRLEELIRPHGLGTDFTSSTFFLAASFLILFTCTNRITRNKYHLFIMFPLLYAGVFFSTSRTVIIAFHISLMFVFLLSIYSNNISHEVKYNIRRNFFLSLVFLCAAVLTTIFMGLNVASDRLFSSFGLLGFKFIGFEGTETTILFDDFGSLVNGVIGIIPEKPLFILFGIGAYNLNYPGLYSEMPEIGEVHFLGDLFLTTGILGMLIYLGVFFQSFSLCWKSLKMKSVIKKEQNDFSLLGLALVILFILSILHYSPLDTGLSTPFIVGLIPLLASYAKQSAALST